jgi:hypothetical protein
MFKKTIFHKAMIAAVLILVLSAGGALRRASAQDSNAGKAAPEPEKTAAANEHSERPPVSAYRLDFSVNEMEDGKKINSRQYLMNLNGNDNSDINIGTRVPAEVSKDGEFQYLDVGTRISSRMHEQGGQLELFVHAEISNFALPEQAQGTSTRPVLRQLKIGASTVVLLGKPMLLGSVDDPNSKRQFQLEVVVTKLR